MALKLNSSGGGSVTVDAPVTASNLTVTLPSSNGTIATTDGTNTTFTSITDSGNLTFTGTGNRITGNWGVATPASGGIAFQNSTTDANTTVYALPNGTARIARYRLGNRSDQTDSEELEFELSSTTASIRSGIRGTGTYLPMTFSTGGSERMRIDTSGNLGIGTSSPVNKVEVSGSITLRQTYQTYLVNSYYDGAWKYAENGMAWGIGNNFGGTTNGMCIATAAVNSSGSGAALTWSPRLNIDPSGNVGIGTTSPTINANGTVLHINNSAATKVAAIHMTNAESGATATDGLIVGKWYDGTNYFYDYDSNAIIFGTNNTNQMTIAADGTITATNGNVLLSSKTAQSASGTSVDFTSIPSWVKRITVMFQGVSLSGTAGFLIQIGSGSLTTTGYVSGGLTAQSSSASSGGFTNTTGFQTNDASAAVYIYNGNIILNNVSGNLWMESGLLSGTSGARGGISGGSITLSGSLDRVRITTTNGTDTFDAGTINILYE